MKIKDLIWVSSSYKDLYKMPDDIIDTMLLGLQLAQRGDRHKNAKTLQGFGGGSVIEIKDTDVSGTYRTVYCVKMDEVIFVLHAFQKKSNQGIKTPKKDIDLINDRLKLAMQIYKETYKLRK